jgi:tetratricopeptide (TPR) repeat protein
LRAGSEEDSSAALRPLDAVRGDLATLRAGTAGPGEVREAVLETAEAVERSLRLLLRDHPHAALPIRLRSLSPEELRLDEVLAELRQLDRITMEVAAAVHDLFEVRHRLRQEGERPTGRDAVLAVRVAEGLERDLLDVNVTEVVPEDAALNPDETWVHPVPPPSVQRSRSRPLAWAALAALALLVALAFWLRPQPQTGELEQGIALFRTGAYADAAAHFFRYAEANPDDVTPRLYLARIHRRMGRTDLAVEELRRALQMAPNDPGVHQELGFLLLDTGRRDEAIQRFRNAIELDAQAPAGWIGLVRALRESGRPAEAERAIAAAPPEVRALLGEAAAGTPRP